jgi:hypothetical protein
VDGLQNIRNLRLKTQIRVEGNLTGLIRPITRSLKKFGTVKTFTDKDTPDIVFVIEHDVNPLDLVNKILEFRPKGVSNVAFIVSTPVSAG